MKKILKFLLSRTFLFGLLIACQVGLFAALMLVFSRAGTVAYIILTLVSVLVVIAVIERDNINPAYKIMWLLIVVALPVTGAVFYLWWGNQGVTPKNARKFADIERAASAAMVQDDAVTEDVRPGARFSPQRGISVPQRLGPHCNTQSEYYPMGQDFFARFLEVIRGAKKYIFMEYFIVEEGEMWNETLAVLKEKAAAGVDVRLIYDGFGSMFTLPGDYDEEIRRAGIKCHVFNPLHFSRHTSDYKMLNHRDHRKITVVDGETAFTGGLNFADEYINRKQRCGVWKDTGLMLEGPGVYPPYRNIFENVGLCGGHHHPVHRLSAPGSDYDADGYVQPYCDSPLDGEAVAESAYLNVLQHARDYVYIVTPYLIVDNEMVTALCLAAKSGVDVRILTPGVPDKWYVYYVTQSYYPRLLRKRVCAFTSTPPASCTQKCMSATTARPLWAAPTWITAACTCIMKTAARSSAAIWFGTC
ncbi:MAG: phospholipase D-like domain-containing protein [Ruthenibacterium lactatiformans]